MSFVGVCDLLVESKNRPGAAMREKVAGSRADV